MVIVEMIAPNDAWGIVRIDDKLYVFRPPYRDEQRLEISPEDTMKAVCDHAFVPINHMCEDTDAAIVFLKEKYVEAMEARGIREPTDEDLRDAWRFASDEILLRCLERAEQEWIPAGKEEAAKRLARDIIGLEKVKEDSEIYRKAAKIIYY